LLGKKVISREALYSNSIAESARLLVDALEHNVSDPQKLIPVYADEPHSTQFIGTHSGNGRGSYKNNSARLFSAELDTGQIRSRAANGEDPLRQLSDTCRAELDSLQWQL
jgi:hypothetical protein